MAARNNSKITKYPRIMNINIGIVLFAVIFIYIIIYVISYFNTKHIVGYEVKIGSLSSESIYTALALREEKLVETTNAGYVNYFATEGARVGVGNLVYTIDESGQLLDYLKTQGTEEFQLSNNDLSELRAQIVDYASGFSEKQFYTVYDFETSLDGTVQKLSNSSILQNIQSLNSGSGTLKSINYYSAADTGTVIYSMDGFEDVTLQTITTDMFDQSTYNKTQLINNNLVEPGDIVYKLCTNDHWSVVIPLDDEERVQELLDLEYVKVRFLKNQYESWGEVDSYTNADGDTFVSFTFTNSMPTFCKDRFLNIELITEEQEGLKIPNSSIVEKSFFIVPKVYVTKGTDGNDGVLRVTYDEQGNETTEFVSTTIYYEVDENYYLADDTLRAGDTIIMLDSNERFTVSAKDSLVGVYNINKGYADFRQIIILYQNNEYSIVKSNTTYGLNVYDYIVLDASTVDENSSKAKNTDKSDDSTDSGEALKETSIDESLTDEASDLISDENESSSDLSSSAGSTDSEESSESAKESSEADSSGSGDSVQ
ncbi:MAG: hypothetical protein K6A23_10675 [Butyrivibrio sp.]|nr:hypothetical protein [Butyrivibrio sp.]